MRRKIIGELIQELIEEMMVLAICDHDGDDYSSGKIAGLDRAIKVLERYMREKE